ncbi:GNAT family N-acetyltransferase [Clostridium boliviensis]|uniref:GNAT family N-acetyltransferase n=1 Tax=Clostridium boliviensis TaxID=318465 RepID=A0ABU4GSS7_9CLOT|nr:GNAT family N-acetyltransferase [Clostridium boliviensis]MDW2800688.1 GNAT family N-acetyltransferase [Clostridium boliviensis]
MNIIETEQLILRELTMDDLEAWYQILSDQETMQYYTSAFDKNQTRKWIDWSLANYNKYGFGLWAVILKKSDEFIGDCGITMQNIYGDGNLLPEIGYHINKRFWNNGYASQAAKACLRYIFEQTDFNEVFSYQMWTNIPSRKVAEKMGMSLRKEYADEKNTKTSVHSITRAEYDSIYKG